MPKAIKTVVWGMGEIYNRFYNALGYLEKLGLIEVVGVTSSDIRLKRIDGYRYIDKHNLKKESFDALIIMSEKYFGEILDEAITQEVPSDVILSYRMLTIPNLNVQQYLSLTKNRVSIISNNCWGGLMYKRLGLKCMSPFKNLYFLDKDYIKLLKNLDKYMQITPEPNGFDYDPVSHVKYPVLSLGDVNIQCNHFSNHTVAIDRWLNLRERLNYDNLFVEMYTVNEDIAMQFSDIEYNRKICFVPFKTELHSCFTLLNGNNNSDFWECVNRTATMQNTEFDQLALIATGRVEKRYEENLDVPF